MDDLQPILLVEDNSDDAELIGYAFRKAQIMSPVVHVGDGERAISYLRGKDAYADRVEYPMPQLVLLDLKLPRRSGFEVLADLRENAQTSRLPVVVLSSSNQEADIRRAYDAGANSFLVKPIGRDALLEMVKALDAFWIKLNRTPST